MSATKSREPGLPLAPQAMAWVATALAWVTGVVYLLIGAGLAPDDLESPPRGVMLVAAAAYFVGGWLIQRLDPRLLRAGAVANALVIFVYVVSLMLGRSDVDAFAVVSKVAQIGLEAVLLVLFVRLPRSAAEVVSASATKQAG
ncbi:MAG TPA: hypothetical protein PKA95_10130 [Thermomicrobiales bacterium]|nr:hypothetical protein [Thermomicrobiales bacterium]